MSRFGFSYKTVTWRLALAVSWVFGFANIAQADWPQFRGLNSGGHPAREQALPAEIGPDKNVAWQIKLPPGHSSPVIVGDKIFVTAVKEKEQLVTLCLERRTGKTMWEVAAPHSKLESIHSIGSHAQSTPACDGERVVSFFGSSGLFCYDLAGKLLWEQRMGPFNNDFGAASSPIIADDFVLLSQDHDTDSFLTAIDKRTGKTVWRTDRSEFPRNFCTPVIWNVNGKKQIVVAATLRVVGYDFATGKELWTVRGISRTVCITPVVGDDGHLFVAGWAAGGDSDGPIRLDLYEKIADSWDKNKDGKFQEEEVPDGPVKQRFSQIDRDDDNGISRQEYEFIQQLFELGRNVVLAIKPGGVGDVTESHVLWTHDRYVPFCASPLFHQERLYTVKEGGIMQCLTAATGKPQKSARLPATGSYYASPVVGDGKLFFANQKGELTIVKPGDRWEVLHSADFGEDIYATPAIDAGQIFIRTNNHLYCFALPVTN